MKMRIPQNPLNRYQFVSLLLGIVLLIGLLFNQWTAVSPSHAQNKEQPSPTELLPADAIQQAWRRAQAAGAYQFSADVTQATIPLPTVTNVGRSADETHLYLEGETDLMNEEMQMFLWSQGGNITQSGDALSIRIEDGKAMAQQSNGAWQALDNFTGSFAPDGDFLAFLAAAKEIAFTGTQSRAVPTVAGLETRSFAVYAFVVDGPGFAAYARDRAQESLAAEGKLPHGANVALSPIYRGMSGSGELWLNENGLPARQILHLQFPEQNEARTEAAIVVDFSGFAENVAVPTTISTALIEKVATPQTAVSFSALILGLALFTFLIRSASSRRAYAAVTIVFITSMMLTPLLQGQRAAALGNEGAAISATTDEASSELPQIVANDPPTGGEALTLIQNDNGTDRDQDGLTDVQETLLGTSPILADTDLDGSDDILSAAAVHLLQVDPDADDDGDGLTNYEESLLGTSSSTDDLDKDGVADGVDSDGDFIIDPLELDGFEYAGKMWYLDATEADTNRDGLADTFECPVENGQLACTDLDNDGEPDAFDADNDGDGIPDRLDISPNSFQSDVFGEERPFELVLDGATTDKMQYVEFQLVPENPDHLWYTFNVLDWPSDELGQMQELDNESPVTFYDLCVSGLAAGQTAAENCTPRQDNGDVKLVPMLEIQVPADSQTLPPTTLLQNYGINVQPINSDNDLAAYVPLQLTTDPTGDRNVAFYGKMLYQPTGDNWNGAHKVRLVWAVQALVDNVCVEVDAGKCVTRANNQVQIIHSYYDDWQLAGMTVREDHGTDLALIYEDPDVDQDLHNDDALLLLANGLSHTFLIGRDCDQILTDGTCLTDGVRDVTLGDIENRFDHDSNSGVSLTQRWGISNTLSVATFSYSHVDEALITTAMTETTTLLNDEFTDDSLADPTLIPNIMVAREERFRELNLDLVGDGEEVAWENGRLTLNFSDGESNPVMVMAALSMSPYRYDGVSGSWQNQPVDEYIDILRQQYEGEVDPLDEEIIQSGKLLAALLYYISLNKGWTNAAALRSGDDTEQLFAPAEIRSDLQLEALATGLLVGGRSGAMKIVNDVVLWRIAQKTNILKYLGFVNDSVVDVLTSQKVTLKTVGTEDTLRGLVTKFQSLKKGGFVGVAAVITVAAGLLGAALLWGPDNTVARSFGALFLGLATFVVLVAVPVKAAVTVFNELRSITSVSNAAKGVLRAHGTLVGMTAKAATVGLVLDIGISWGVFIYQVAANNLDPGTVAFNSLLAFSIAATVIAVLYFILSLTAVGFILVSVVAVIDLFLLFFCEAGLDGACFGITKEITEALASFVYTVESTINLDIEDKDGNALLVEWDDLSYALTDPSQGFVAGNGIVYDATIFTNLYHKAPSEIGAVWADFVTEEALTQSTFAYNLTLSTEAPAAVLLGEMNELWYTDNYYTQEYRVVIPPTVTYLDLFYGVKRDDITSPIYTLEAGVNKRIPLYFQSSFIVPAYECWLDFCNSQNIANQDSTFIGAQLTFDIYPETVEEFYNLQWSGIFEHEEFDGNDQWYALDHDGDGLLNTFVGGNDPNDSVFECGGLCWDTDGDGLSDAFELEMRQGGIEIDPENANSDSDELTDAEELFWNSDPTQADTDGDGLLDHEEVNGWLFTYGSGKSTWVTSDPLDPDTDGDGIDDALEKTLHESDPTAFPYNPRVFNQSPVALYVSTDQQIYTFAPGDAFNTITAVRNELALDLYANGSLQMQIPLLFWGGTDVRSFNLYRGEELVVETFYQIPSDTSSQTVTFANEATAVLQDSLNQTAPSGTIITSRSLAIQIDNDAPTATMTTPAYVIPGGVRIIGGEATDPTSTVDFVEIRVDGGPWQPVMGSASWAYAWSVPNTPGSHIIELRATDFVGNVQSSVSQYTVFVDDTPPTINISPELQGNPFTAASRNSAGLWTVPLAGTAVDADAGIRTVEVRLEPGKGGWQSAAYNPADNTWSLEYELGNFGSDNKALTEATGQYTIHMRAVDFALDKGNSATIDAPIRLDTTSPTVTLDDLQPTDVISGTEYTIAPQPITTTQQIGGSVTDAGSVGAGVDSVEIAFVPIDAVQSLADPALLLLLNEPPQATTFVDLSGQRLNGVCLVGQCPSSDADGRFGTAASFNNAQNQYIDFNGVTLANNEYSALLWFNTTCTDCGLFAADAGILGNQGNDRDLYLEGGNVCAATTTGTAICSEGANFADGQWHMVAQTLSSDSHRLYLDGELAASGVSNGSPAVTLTGVNVGHSLQASTPFFNGRLDNTTLFNLTLSPEAVRGFYQSWSTVVPVTPGDVATTWSSTVPAGLEGQYQIDLTGSDVLGNRNDLHSTWNHWRGEIDTAAPRVTLSRTYIGSGSTAQTRYEGSASDANLTDLRFAAPCTLEPANYQYGGDGQLEHLNVTCTVPGWQKETVFLRACDAYDHCAAAFPDQQFLYWTEDHRLERAPLAGSQTTESMIQTLVTGQERAHGIRLDIENGRMYWAEFGSGTDTGQIWRANLDGTAAELLVSGIPSPPVDNRISTRPPQRFGLALDVNANKMVWTETATGLIKQANLDGSGVTTLVDMWAIVPSNTSLSWIVLDAENQQLYWLQGRNGSLFAFEIWQADANGNNPRAIYTDGRFLDGLAVDSSASKLYWTETVENEDGVIMQANLDGSDPTALYTGLFSEGQSNFGTIALDAASDTIFWRSGTVIDVTNPADIIATQSHLRQVDQDGSSGKRVYPLTLPDTLCGAVCPFVIGSIDGGGQNGLDVGLVPGGSLETTDLAVTLATDSDLALVGQTLTYDLTIHNQGPLDALNTQLDVSIPTGLDVASFPGCTVNGATAVCDLGNLLEGDEISLQVVLNVQSGANGRLESQATVSTAIGDHVPGNNTASTIAFFAPPPPTLPADGQIELFTADAFNDSVIEQIDYPIGRDPIVPSGSAGNVRDLIVDPATELLYWTDEGNGGGDGRLWQSALNGQNQTILLEGLNFPHGLTLDPLNNTLYWSESDKISRIDLTSNSVEIVLDALSSRAEDLAVDPYRQYLFWESASNTIFRFDLATEATPVAILTGLTALDSLAIDVYGGKIIWGKNNYYGAIYRANMDGSQSEVWLDDVRTSTGFWFEPSTNDLYWYGFDGAGIVPGYKLYRTAVGSTSKQLLDAGFQFAQGVAGWANVPQQTPPTISSTPILAATSGQPYTYQVQATGSQPFSWSLTDAPAGLSINANSGLISWTPAGTGSFNVTVQASNTAGIDTQSYTLEVTDPAPPTITSMPVTGIEVNQPYSYQAQASSIGAVTWSLNESPAGMVVDPASGLITWTPAVTGTFTVELQAANLGGATTQSFAVNVFDFVFLNQLYWTEFSSTSIQRIDPGQGAIVTLHDANDTTSSPAARSIAVDSLHQRLYWIEGQPTTSGGSDYILQADAIGNNIEILLSNVDAFDIEVDVVNGYLYWTDDFNGRIQRADIDGTNVITIATELTKPTSLALDIGRNRLFWVSGYWYETSNALMSARLDGSEVTTLLSGLSRTSHLALDGELGQLYWQTEVAASSSADGSFTIHQADYDASGTLSNVSDFATGIFPAGYAASLTVIGGLALDLDEDNLYWITSGPPINQQLWQAPRDGSNPTMVIDTDPSETTDSAAVYPYYEDYPGPQTAVTSPTDGSTLNRFDPVTVSGVITAPVTAKSLTVRQLIDGSWTPVYSQTWQTGEVTTANWQFEWQTPTEGETAVGEHQFEVEIVDWADRSTTLPYTLTIEAPPVDPPGDVVLPPNFGTIHAEMTAPANGTVFSTANPIDLTGGAAATSSLSLLELRDLSSGDLLLSDSWADGAVFTTTFTTTWTPPALSDTYQFELRAVGWDGSEEVITHTLSIALPPAPSDEPPGYEGPLLDSVILTPSGGTLLTALDPVNVAGEAFAVDSLQNLTVTVNGTAVFSQSWPDGESSEASWNFDWTPPADGSYTLLSEVTDWAGRVQTNSPTIQADVRQAMPEISIDRLVLTTTQQVSSQAITLTGTTTAGEGSLVEVQIDGGSWIPVPNDGATWRYQWPVINEDGVTHDLSARVTDGAGRTAVATESILVDVVPPSLVEIGLSYLNGGSNVSFAPGETVYDSNPTLVIDWTAATDGSGLGDYLVGWTTSPTPTAAALTAYTTSGTHQQAVTESETWYAHVGVPDSLGNITWQTRGPITVDGPATPDFIANLAYDGWMGSGATQIGANRELSFNAPDSASLKAVQRFFLSWDDTALRLGWTGADWNSDGDLFIYLDTAVGGATEAYNPFGDGVTITLPSENGQPLVADTLVWVEDDQTVTLLSWDDSAWVVDQSIPAENVQLNGRSLDLLLPFSWLNLTNASALKLVALASEEDALQLWATMPDKNPLNSPRVISPLAFGRELNSFALTQYYEWASLPVAPGILPNEGQFTDGDLRVTLTAVPSGTTVGLLNSDLLDLLSPGSRLDADLDGVLDITLPMDLNPVPLADGQLVAYTITYSNRGTENINNAQLQLTAFGGIQFAGGATQTVDLGPVTPGASGSITVEATVNAALNGQAAEVTAVLSDDTHEAFDWFWIQHDLDTAAPSGLTIETPQLYARPQSQTLFGLVQDASTIANVEVEMVTTPGGSSMTLTCPDGNSDGTWSCIWPTGTLETVESIEIRARATDLVGNQSDWTNWRTLLVDLAPPSVLLDTAVDDALLDGYLGPDELLLSGTVQDDNEARSVALCLLEAAAETCFTLAATPGNAPNGTWLFNTTPLQAGDGITQTLTLAGLDGLGHRSEEISRTYQIDTIAPTITVTTTLTEAALADVIGGNGPVVLGGVVQDGGEVADVVVRLEDAQGNVVWQTAVLTDDSWAFSPQLSEAGVYQLSVEAYDVAGNSRGLGTVSTLTVTATGGNSSPVATDDSASINEGDSVTIDVLANDTDVDEDTLIVESVTQPTSGMVVNNGTDVSYTHDGSATTSDSFSYTVSDGNGGTDTAIVSITIVPGNNVPVANDDGVTTDENTAVTIDVLANDTDADGDILTVDSTTQPTNGTVVNNGSDVTYTPDANFNGSDSFSYTASDGNGGSDTATVTVTVGTINNAPEVGPITAPLVPVQIDTSIEATAVYTDVDGLDTLTAVWEWGDGNSTSQTLTGTNGSAIANHTYTEPDVYIVTLTVTDAAGATATAYFEYVVVFDPSVGSANGVGWFYAPADSYYEGDPTLSETGRIGFVVRYRRNLPEPVGNFNFTIHPLGSRLTGLGYDWLVINGNRATFQGYGDIDGSGEYGFFVSVIDDGTQNDLVRVRIWNRITGELIYATQPDDALNMLPTVPLSGGSITIRRY